MNKEIMQESGVEWIGAIPQGWKVKIIKRTFDIKLGKMLQPLQKAESDTEEYYLKTSNIYWDGVDINDIKKMWFSPLDKINTELKYNDLLVCEGGDVGRSALWKEEITPCYIQNAINRVRPIHNCSTKFLYYWLFLLKHSGYIDAMVSRITIAHLTAEKLERLVFLLPPCSEQQAIAQYLDERCGKLDKIIAIKQQQIKTLDALRQSIIYQAVTKGLDASVSLVDSGVEWLGEIPKGWKVKRIKDFGKVIGGFAFKSSDFRQEGALILKISNVSHLSLKWDDISYLPENYEIIYSDYVAPPNSLIFALTRPIIKAGIKTVKLLENESFLINQRVGFFKPSNKINNSFLIYVTQSSGFVSIFENKITSSTIQPNISTEQIESIKFFCPPISEQQAIADHLDQETQRLDQLKANLNQQINVLSDYKKSLIYECVTGKKRVINTG